MISGIHKTVWWVILFSASLIFYFSELLESSMYIDGVWYAVISQNLAAGKGSVWFPQFSATFFNHFHEHPPMLFWLQASFFKLFGDHWWTERLFSFTQYFGIAGLIVLFWRKVFHHQISIQKLWFIPLLLWQINLANYFYLPANLMESTLIIFDMAAIGCLWKVAENRNPWLNLSFAALLLMMAILTKGFVGLFPLAFLGIYWLIFRNISFWRVCFQTSSIIVILLFGFLLLFWAQPQSFISLSKYLDIQVLASLNGERKLYYFRDNRLFIIGQLIWVLMPIFLFFLGHYVTQKLIPKQKNSPQNINRYHTKLGLVFLLVGLSASVPLMVSPRQAMPYLLPSIPFYCLAFGIWMTPFFMRTWQYFFEKLKYGKLILLLPAIIGLFAASFWCISKFQTPNRRDQVIISDIQQIGKVVGNNQIISSSHYDMYLSGYLMRLFEISIDTTNLNLPFLLLQKNDTPPAHFQPIQLETNKYNIYKKMEPENLLSTSEYIKLLHHD